MQVHYNRISKDGLFSHKEITVLFVPNLSECLPSVDMWKNNWILYKKSKAEREQLTIKKEKVTLSYDAPSILQITLSFSGVLTKIFLSFVALFQSPGDSKEQMQGLEDLHVALEDLHVAFHLILFFLVYY